MLWKRIIVGDQERALITKNGRFGGIRRPVNIRLFVPPGVSLDVEKYNVRDLSSRAPGPTIWRKNVRNRGALLHAHGNERLPGRHVYVDGELFKVMLPAKRLLFWRGAMEVTAEVVNVIDDPQLPAQKLPALERLGKESFGSFCLVEEAKIRLLNIDNRFARNLSPGKYGFWAVTGSRGSKYRTSFAGARDAVKTGRQGRLDHLIWRRRRSIVWSLDGEPLGRSTPISSFHRFGLSAINFLINSMHSSSCNTSTCTPFARRWSSAPRNVWFSPAMTRGIL